MLFDFKVFYAAGQAILAGHSPYADPNFLYPLPMAYFFALWALLPFDAAIGLWWLALALTLAAVCRRTAMLWFLFPPVFAQFITGQLDLLVLGLWTLAGRGAPVALGLMTLKPHLTLVLVLYMLWQWRRESRKLWLFALTVLILWLPLTLIYPWWLLEWSGNRKPLSEMLAITPSAFALTHLGGWATGIAVLLGIAILVWSWRRGREFANLAGVAVNPVIQFYDLALIASPRLLWRTVLAGWIAWLVYLVTSMAAVHFIILPVAFWELKRSSENSLPARLTSGVTTDENGVRRLPSLDEVGDFGLQGR